MPVDISDIEAIIEAENKWRQTQAINLIASENTPSEAVRRVQQAWAAGEEVREPGQIRALGVSTFSVAQMAPFRRISPLPVL